MSPEKVDRLPGTERFARSGSQNSIHQAHQRRRTTTDGMARRRSQTGYRATATFACLPASLPPSVPPSLRPSRVSPLHSHCDETPAPAPPATATAMGTTAKIFKLNPSFRARREAETDERAGERPKQRARKGESAATAAGSETVFRTVTNTLRSDSRGAA